MPELPEVETVRLGLEKTLGLKTEPAQILVIKLFHKDLRFPMPSKKKLDVITHARIFEIQRRAKYIIFRTSKGDLISHLGMTGSWRWDSSVNLKQLRSIKKTHDHISIFFANGSLIYNDPRRFGIFDILLGADSSDVLESSKYFKHLGPEPLHEIFSADYLFAKSRGKEVSVKVFLMDQKVVVGVGNIYASEALFLSKIKPNKKAKKLSHECCQRLVINIKAVLHEAIRQGGSSISDFSHVDQNTGYFQNSFKVYGREGQSCFVCNEKVRNTVLAGRSSFWCPSCQS